MSGTDANIPPAWYPDAEVDGGQRWWDGTAWTDYRKTAAEVAAEAPAQATPAYVAPTYAAPAYTAPAAQGYVAPTSPYALGGQPYGYAAAPVPIVDPVTGQVPLWAPLYGASIVDAWKRFWRKYADFSGRASRSEFWFAYLAMVIVIFGSYILLGILGAVTGAVASSNRDVAAVPGVLIGFLGLFLMLGYLAMIIPFISASVRRLHDAGYPGTYYLLGFIPIVGGILLIVFLAMESKPQGAIYDRPTV